MCASFQDVIVKSLVGKTVKALKEYNINNLIVAGGVAANKGIRDAFEKESLINIDLMKTEITSIHKHTNPEKTSVSYALSKEKENKLHDDRFYTIILLAHRLYEIRRSSIVNKKATSTNKLFVNFKAPKLYAQ